MDPTSTSEFSPVRWLQEQFPRGGRSARAIELLALGLVAAFVLWRCWCAPAEAVNMPQESGKYAVGAWHLYQTGRYELHVNGQACPVSGGLGYAFLIVPSYWLFGDFLGNAIFTQLALALLTCLGIYLAVRLCFGIGPALIAAVLPALYPSFNEYARANDTCIPTACFLVAGLLLFYWIARRPGPRVWQWLLWGLCAGWAFTLRGNDFVTFSALTLGLLWLLRPRLRQAAGWLAVAALGAAPLVVPWLVYNHHYCGAWLRDGRAFWNSNSFDVPSRLFAWRCAFGMPDYSQINPDHGNVVFYAREIGTQFSNWFWLMHGTPRYVIGALFTLSAVMIAGLVFAVIRARQSPPARLWLLAAGLIIGPNLALYFFCRAVEARYCVPLSPFFGALLGLGLLESTRRWRRYPGGWLLVCLFWVAAFASVHYWLQTKPNRVGDVAPRAAILVTADQRVESNAVLICSSHFELVEYFLQQGTQRLYVPMDHSSAFRVQPNPPKDKSRIPFDLSQHAYPGDLDNGAVDLIGFSARENPERIQEFLDQRVPVYLIDFSFGLWTHDELVELTNRFELVPISVGLPKGRFRSWFQHPGVFLWRLQPMEEKTATPASG